VGLDAREWIFTTWLQTMNGMAATHTGSGLQPTPGGFMPAQGNRNTELKAKIFDQALERFQKRLAELEEAPEKTAATGKEPTSSTKPPSPKKPALGKAKAKAKAKASSGKAATESSKAARKDAKIIQSGVKKTLGHSRGRGWRSQARKDSR
jgi:hypothetical protein